MWNWILKGRCFLSQSCVNDTCSQDCALWELDCISEVGRLVLHTKITKFPSRYVGNICLFVLSQPKLKYSASVLFTLLKDSWSCIYFNFSFSRLQTLSFSGCLNVTVLLDSLVRAVHVRLRKSRPVIDLYIAGTPHASLKITLIRKLTCRSFQFALSVSEFELLPAQYKYWTQYNTIRTAVEIPRWIISLASIFYSPSFP